MRSQIEVMEMGEVWIARCKLMGVSAIGKTRDDAIRAIVEMRKIKTEI